MKYPAHHHDRHKLKGNICSFGTVKEAARQQNIVPLLVLVEKLRCRTPQAVFCNTKPAWQGRRSDTACLLSPVASLSPMVWLREQ